MVGQILKSRYLYYRCRRAFAGAKHDRCPTVYVRADALEQAVREEAARVLANPEVVLVEAERVLSQGVRNSNVYNLEIQLNSLENRRGRLLKLYEMGEIDDEYFLRQSNTLRAEKAKVEEQINSPLPIDTLPNITDLQQACGRIRDWVLKADGDDFSLLLDALQIQVHVEKGHGELEGVIPYYASTCNHADFCAMVGSIIRIPFSINLATD